MSEAQMSLKYDCIYAIDPKNNRVIVKLSGHGYAIMSGNICKKNDMLNVADFAASHLKFTFGEFKKVNDDSEVDPKVIENVKYTLENAAGYYGVLHPGLKIDGIE